MADILYIFGELQLFCYKQHGYQFQNSWFFKPVLSLPHWKYGMMWCGYIAKEWYEKFRSIFELKSCSRVFFFPQFSTVLCSITGFYFSDNLNYWANTLYRDFPRSLGFLWISKPIWVDLKGEKGKHSRLALHIIYH